MPESRKWYQFWKRDPEIVETNASDVQSEHDVTHEFNTNLGVAYMRMLNENGEMPYSIQDIRTYTSNPFLYIQEIRSFAHWAYYTNGVVASAIDYMKSMHTLDGVVVCKTKRTDGKRPRNYRMNKSKMEATLKAIRYKQMIRDAIFKNANDGMYVAYFETVASAPDYRAALTDYDIYNITEINSIGMNATVIPLPIDYVRIVGRRNNSYQVAFDLRYFNDFTDEARKRKLVGFPKEIQEGWLRFSNDQSNPWIVLNNDKTIVTKIKSAVSDPYGVPFAVAALDDISYAQYFVDTKRNVLDSVNNQIVYETFPEGREKGTSALTDKQQKEQHNLIKSALNSSKSRNASGTSFFSLASGTKLDSISLDVSLLDEKNENSIVDSVNKDLGVSASALDGSSSGNYSTANLNLELVASSVYTWIEDIVDELNKCINKNIINDSTCLVEFYVLPITMVNKDNMVKYMHDLYSQGKGSLYAWISSTGFNPENYIALMDYELQEDFENRYPVHRTSFTITGKDSPEEDHNRGGRPTSNSNNPSTVQTKTNGANNQPRPSTG